MGHHDPLDGFITYSQLQAISAKYSERSTWLDLHAEIADMANMCKGKSWVTDDPLGIGELLGSAYKAGQLMVSGYLEQTALLEVLVGSSLPGLESYGRKNPLRVPADDRLAFRELGLSIGLRAAERLERLIEENLRLFNKKLPLHSQIKRLMRYRSFSEIIEMFWLKDANREADSWIAHRDINMVMLATSLAPDGYLTL
jgi:hypothetical protein